MSKIPSLLAITLLMAAQLAGAEDDSSDDLRYCLELQSNYDIAKCAGEISPGGKGKPYSKEEVDKILSEEQASAPISPKESPDTEAPDNQIEEADKILSEQQTSAPASPKESADTPAPDNQIKDLLLENDEGSGNQ